MNLPDILRPEPPRPLRDIRPDDYIAGGPMISHRNLDRLFKQAFEDGFRLRLVLTQDDLLSHRDRDSTHVHRYRTGVAIALYRAAEVVIVMSDGRRWIYKSPTRPQGFEEAA